MNKNEFLNQSDIQSFVLWLIENLPNFKYKLSFKSSRFTPNGLNVDVSGFENVLQHYYWKTSWVNENGENIVSGDWETTKKSHKLLKKRIFSAIKNNNSLDTRDACLAILNWGGVSGAVPFLHRMEKNNQVIPYLESMKNKLNPSENINLEGLNENTVQRFDAGMTKIHAIIDDNGSPIYDSRVGAAISLLYQMYKRENGEHKNCLNFSSGDARGCQIRNPGDIGYESAPKFFTHQVTSHQWAQDQLKLSWIIRAVLEKTNWFSTEGKLNSRCHAFEAVLFMLGYDLNCFFDNSLKIHKEVIVDNQCKVGNWVPAGHPFVDVINYLHTFIANEEAEINYHSFKEWLVSEKNIKPSTANSYTFPLKINEFDLFNSDLKRISRIASGGEEGLNAAMCGAMDFRLGDEREHVCLVDAYLAGMCSLYADKIKPYELLIKMGCAGTKNSANTLLNVGRSVGKHFSLLDNNNFPTKIFTRFFGDELNDLRDEIFEYVK